MDTETALQEIERIWTPWAIGSNRPEPNRLDIAIEPDSLLPATQALRAADWGFMAAITGMDLGVEAGAIDTLYHFTHNAAVASLRMKLPRSGAIVESIAAEYPAASFFEREFSEMYGVTVLNTPDPSHLFLPEGWPEGAYPMLKDYDPTKYSPPQAFVPQPGKVGDKFIVPIGPQHPALKEPGHFVFTVDGEMVTSARMRLGYAHRGIEKSVENRNWVQALYVLERVCGICSHTHSSAYCNGVERLAGVEIPPRAGAIRMIVAGLERIHSHLLWLGVAAHEAGFDTLFMLSWRDRETVMDLLEMIGGNRVNYSANILGGVKVDFDQQIVDSIRKGFDYLEERTRHYLKVVTTDSLFLQRTRGVGRVTKEEAIRLGLLGPTARASGVVRDVRVEAPYGSYAKFPMGMVLDDAGDLEARFVVRLKELLLSYNTMRTMLDHLPEGDLSVRMPKKIPAGETVSRVEAPRGEVFYFIKSNGSDKPERIKIRTPSLCNWMAVLEKAVGSQLADMPMLISGMDPCFSCNDRMITILRPEEAETWNWAKLRQYGIDYYNNRKGGR